MASRPGPRRPLAPVPRAQAAIDGIRHPRILVRGEDNAATELIEEGVNGFVADSADPEDLARQIMRVHEAGQALRQSTAEWFRRNARRLSIDASVEAVLAEYVGMAPR